MTTVSAHIQLKVSHFWLQSFFYFIEFFQLLLLHTFPLQVSLSCLWLSLPLVFTSISVTFMLSSVFHVFLSMLFAFCKCRCKCHLLAWKSSHITQMYFWSDSRGNLGVNELFLSYIHVSHSLPKFQAFLHKCCRHHRKVYLLCHTWGKLSRCHRIKGSMLFMCSKWSKFHHKLL